MLVRENIADKNGIRYLTYESDFRPGGCGYGKAWCFKNRGKVMELKFDDVWNELKDIDLNQRQQLDLDNLLKNNMRSPIFHPNPTEYIKEIIHNYGIDPKKDNISIFPNLTWDGAAVGRRTIFNSVNEWLETTINFLSTLPVNIIVRIHPAEKMIFEGDTTKDKVEDFINGKKFNNINNLFIIGSNSPVSSYSLIKKSKVVIVYTSTIGLESAIQGIPTIFCGDSKDINRGFGCVPKSKKEYYALLDGYQNLDVPLEQIENARKWAYIYNFILPIPLQLFEVNKQFNISRYSVKSSKDVAAGKMKNLDFLIGDIINDCPIYNKLYQN